MSGARGEQRNWRSVFLTLAAIALFLKILVPPGYMVDSRTPSFHLVICTGHGPLDLDSQGDSKAPAHKSAESPCAFAGAVTPIAPPLPTLIAAPAASPTERVVDAKPRDLAPGRGFAAPPPPSQAPPTFTL